MQAKLLKLLCVVKKLRRFRRGLDRLVFSRLWPRSSQKPTAKSQQPTARKGLGVATVITPLNSEALNPLNSEALNPLNSEALNPLNSEALNLLLGT